MVPVEVTAFGLLAACAIVLAVVQAVQVLAPAQAVFARIAMLVALLAVAIAAVYVWATTRIP
jgi:hypothetical protein